MYTEFVQNNDKTVVSLEQTARSYYRGEDMLDSIEKFPIANGEETLPSGLRLKVGLKGGQGAVSESGVQGHRRGRARIMMTSNVLVQRKLHQNFFQANANVVEAWPIFGLFTPTLAHEVRVWRSGMRVGDGRPQAIADYADNNLQQQEK